MRKRIIESADREISRVELPWLNLEELARVEVTSEDPAHPIESALVGESTLGWRAQRSGRQTIRLLFDQPQKVSRVSLVFREEEHERTQEFVLRYSLYGSPEYREIVRQQYTFSPSGTTTEHENYEVELDGVTLLELLIVPDISRGPAKASLERLNIAP